MWGAVTNPGQCTAALQRCSSHCRHSDSNINCRGFTPRVNLKINETLQRNNRIRRIYLYLKMVVSVDSWIWRIVRKVNMTYYSKKSKVKYNKEKVKCKSSQNMYSTQSAGCLAWLISWKVYFGWLCFTSCWSGPRSWSCANTRTQEPGPEDSNQKIYSYTAAVACSKP